MAGLAILSHGLTGQESPGALMGVVGALPPLAAKMSKKVATVKCGGEAKGSRCLTRK